MFLEIVKAAFRKLYNLRVNINSAYADFQLRSCRPDRIGKGIYLRSLAATKNREIDARWGSHTIQQSNQEFNSRAISKKKVPVDCLRVKRIWTNLCK